MEKPIESQVAELMSGFERMRARLASIREEVVQSLQGEQTKRTCQKHGTIQVVDIDRSVAETNKAGQVTLAFTACAQCAVEAALAAKSLWLHLKGVPMNLCHASFPNFKPTCPADNLVLEKAKQFAKRPRGVLLIIDKQPNGNYGAGKTHLAVSILREVGKGFFTTNDDLLNSLRLQYRDSKAEDLVSKCRRTSLLVLDELGISAGGRDEAPMLHSIFTARIGEVLPIVVTSNLGIDQIGALLGPRVMDRLKECRNSVLFCEGASHRDERRRDYMDRD